MLSSLKVVRYKDGKENEWKHSQRPLGELLLKTNLKIKRKSGSLQAKYKEIRRGSRLLHSTAMQLFDTEFPVNEWCLFRIL